METLKIGIILGSTRDGRQSPNVGKWILKKAQSLSEDTYEILDLNDFDLPFLGTSTNQESVKRWQARVAQYDGFIFIVQEYNHSLTGALKNALDSAYTEWNNKAAAIVSYGSAYGARAAEALRLILAELQVADVRNQVLLSLFTDFKEGVFAPQSLHDGNVQAMIEQLTAWARALKTLR